MLLTAMDAPDPALIGFLRACGETDSNRRRGAIVVRLTNRWISAEPTDRDDLWRQLLFVCRTSYRTRPGYQRRWDQ